MLLWGLLVALMAGGAWQANAATPVRGKKDTKQPTAATQDVWVGAYLMRIHQINIRENYLTADFYIWFRWKADQLKPYKTFSLVDARQETRAEPVVENLPDGSHYAYIRVVAQLTKFWDLRRYPLDSHDVDLNIEEEESEDHLVRYLADEVNSGADPNLISMPGWKLLQTSALTGAGVYRSNFGDSSIPTGQETRYSRFTLRTRFARRGSLVFMKLLFGVWTGAGISFVAFFISPHRIDPRFGVGVGAIFAAIASEYIITQSLPDTNVVTLADKLHVLAFAFIFLAIVESTCSLSFFEKGQERRSARLDRTARWVFPGLFVVFNALIVWLR